MWGRLVSPDKSFHQQTASLRVRHFRTSLRASLLRGTAACSAQAPILSSLYCHLRDADGVFFYVEGVWPAQAQSHTTYFCNFFVQMVTFVSKDGHLISADAHL